MSNKQTTGSYAFPLALAIGVSTAIALDNYLIGLAIGVGLYFAFSDPPKKVDHSN
ncbi:MULTISPECIES: hypothetical protein [Exiguobacterium]|uniref:hypothetical protein n=1 Tax=Exiguobacterium TaxID=33986 RepID=UPI001BE81D6F|nr:MULTISPECIES: hypothetical protein [Exiguobacterium]MCT4776049.1 hypothetical protein [Exiguobacterium aquaticum]MCT4788041.1 hypothetical protein [Exiguobacterium mexicanum]